MVSYLALIRLLSTRRWQYSGSELWTIIFTGHLMFVFVCTCACVSVPASLFGGDVYSPAIGERWKSESRQDLSN
jgi:hypothetical protein